MNTPARSRTPLALSLCLALAHCGPGTSPSDTGAQDAVTEAAVEDATTPADASVEDAAPDGFPDVPIPPGDPGRVLMVRQTEDWRIASLRAPVQVVRTEVDVPHVYAASARDAYVVMGFLSGRDRYTQMELARRLGRGLISPLLGDAGLAADQRARGQGYTTIAQRFLTQITTEQRDMLDAYAEGFNAYVDAVQARRLPVPTELPAVGLLLGVVRSQDLMEHITRDDLAAILAVVLFNSSFTSDDLVRARLAAQFPAMFRGAPNEMQRRTAAEQEIFDRVRPVTSVSSSPGLGLERGTRMASRTQQPRTTRQPQAPAQLRVRRGDTTAVASVPVDVIDRARAAAQQFEHARRGAVGADYGSNAWAVSSRGTTDNSALLSSDGHLPLSIPTLLYQMGVDTTVFGATPASGRSLLGLFFPGIPAMAIGTNGKVAYGFTYLYGDLTDWYAEELELDAMGRPASSRFRGMARPLTAVNETYTIGRGTAARTEMWPRYTTFDGRWIASIEGRPATRETVAPAGQSVVNVQGELVIPADTNGDGKISAVSFDYVGFDVGNLFDALQGFENAQSVEQAREAQRGFVAFAQNFIVADSAGRVHYSGYTATPCRGYLPHPEGVWAAGADPRRLIDGTQYGAFSIPLLPNGRPDESMGASDPSKCIVPFDQWPSSLDPDRGYVFTANNDFGELAADGNLANGPFYLGGPWEPGYRSRTVRDTLAGHVMRRDATIERMAALQGNHTSVVGQQFVPFLREAIASARTLAASSTPPANEADRRLVAIYRAESAAMDEVSTRLEAWLTRGANAASGVTTFYDPSPTDNDRADAAATMLFNAWFRQLFAAAFGDEGLDEVFATDARFLTMTTLTDMFANRGDNTRNLGSWSPTTRESIWWDDTRTAAVVESSREITLTALTTALTQLRAAPDAMRPGTGGFGTSDMSQWLWGLRHMVALESIITAYAGDVMGVDVITNQLKISPARLPLAEALAMNDPRRTLPWFPRPGDLLNVDASNPPFAGDEWTYRNGPVMRMVVQLGPDGRVRGQNIIPGGQSGVASSSHFDDQARLYLGNRTVPMRYDLNSVLEGAVGREAYHP